MTMDNFNSPKFKEKDKSQIPSEKIKIALNQQNIKDELNALKMQEQREQKWVEETLKGFEWWNPERKIISAWEKPVDWWSKQIASDNQYTIEANKGRSENATWVEKYIDHDSFLASIYNFFG